MKQAGYRFRIVVSDVRETVPRGISPKELVKTLALKKAVAVSKAHPAAVVLGADTVVYINNRIVGKPRDKKHAVKILRELSGAWQKVYTGVAVAWAGGKRHKKSVAVSSVKMRHLNDKDLAWASAKHLDKAGAYAVQEKRDPFVERIVGDYDNVVGLPMRVVKKLLAGIN
jgi:septum formation protein